jgi:hypothetical protein
MLAHPDPGPARSGRVPPPTMGIEPLGDPRSAAFHALVLESEAAGHPFLRRLVDEWASGRNRFDRPGEVLLAARVGERLAGVCGLNVDPYAAATGVGRVRHLYVCLADRRLGVGRLVATAEPDRLRDALAAACGVVGVVRKRRTVRLVGRTRVHLDTVEGLGGFVELEVVLEDGEVPEHGVAEARRLMAALGIGEHQLVRGAYVDLLPAGGA